MYVKEVLANKLKATNEGVGSVTIDKVTGDDFSIDNEGVGKVNVGFYKGGKLDIDNEGVGKVSARWTASRLKRRSKEWAASP